MCKILLRFNYFFNLNEAAFFIWFTKNLRPNLSSEYFSIFISCHANLIIISTNSHQAIIQTRQRKLSCFHKQFHTLYNNDSYFTGI